MAAVVRLLPNSAAAVAGTGELITVAPGDASRPVVLVPALSGSIVPYRELAGRLAGTGDDRAVVAVESAGLHSGNPARSMADAADHIVDSVLGGLDPGVRSVDFVGWSFGGVLAVEAAARCTDRGRPARAAAIDTDLRPPVTGTADLPWGLLDPDGTLVADPRFAAGTPAGSRLRGVARAHLSALRWYRPAATLPAGTLALIAADGPGAQARRDSWHGAGAARVRTVPGRHASVLHTPHLEAVLAELTDWLAGTDAG